MSGRKSVIVRHPSKSHDTLTLFFEKYFFLQLAASCKKAGRPLPFCLLSSAWNLRREYDMMRLILINVLFVWKCYCKDTLFYVDMQTSVCCFATGVYALCRLKKRKRPANQ